jgi:hypothetical protein
MTAKTAEKPFRISCSEHTVPAGSYDAAFRRRFQIETLGACTAEHTIEARTASGQWRPAYLALAETILAAKVGSKVETFDGPLTKNSGQWSQEASRKASAVAAEGTPEWAAAARKIPHETATLTSDGRGAMVKGWCACGGTEQVRYERWSARGREAHGFVCTTCRYLTQTG